MIKLNLTVKKSHVPSLRALHACESVARLGGVKKAALELGVTPAAISQLLRGVELDLETKLFTRVERNLVPRAEAHDGLKDLEAAFELVHQAVRKLREPRPSKLLTVSVDPAFASCWLVQRLSGFRLRHPSIDVLIDATNRYDQPNENSVDMVIRFGTARETDLVKTILFRESVFPVCSPDLLVSGSALHPSELADLTLIHLDWSSRQGTWPTWNDWLRAAKVAKIAQVSGLLFSDHALALAAAIRGDGVALGSTALTCDAIRSRALVCPTDVILPTAFSYYAAVHPDRESETKIRVFREWLEEEAKASAQSIVL